MSEELADMCSQCSLHDWQTQLMQLIMFACTALGTDVFIHCLKNAFSGCTTLTSASVQTDEEALETLVSKPHTGKCLNDYLNCLYYPIIILKEFAVAQFQNVSYVVVKHMVCKRMTSPTSS